MSRWPAIMVLIGACHAHATPPSPVAPSSPVAPPQPATGAEISAPSHDGAADPCQSLAALSECLPAAIGALQREPAQGALEAFVLEARGASVTVCADAGIDRVPWDRVQWSRSETGTSHYDDTTMEVHIRYELRVDSCAPAIVPIDLRLGAPLD